MPYKWQRFHLPPFDQVHATECHLMRWRVARDLTWNVLDIFNGRQVFREDDSLSRFDLRWMVVQLNFSRWDGWKGQVQFTLCLLARTGDVHLHFVKSGNWSEKQWVKMSAVMQCEWRTYMIARRGRLTTTQVGNSSRCRVKVTVICDEWKKTTFIFDTRR